MKDLAAAFRVAGCDGSVSVVRLSDGERVEHAGGVPRVMASLVKVPIALEFYTRVEIGDLDESAAVALDPQRCTPGPVGISRFRFAVTASLADLAYLMLTISDNAATDVVIGAVGVDRVNEHLRAIGCNDTVVVGTLAETLDGFANDLGFDDYAQLLDAQRGSLGPEARVASIDPHRIGGSRALDASAASRTTAADLTRLLTAVWADTAGPAEACGRLRSVMAEQVTRRLGPVVLPGGALAAKSGGLFRRVRNEMGVITDPGGDQYAVAVLTRTESADIDPRDVEAAMVETVGLAIAELRTHQQG
ncbi:MAG TPA: serine hydrolase [Acidimicrobiales bacterium]|nr:serine hydrolase [Acidimicrobiales bacterium]